MKLFQRRLEKSVTTMALQLGGAAALAGVILWAPRAYAYKWYDDGAGNGCVQCHLGFQGGNGPLHSSHRFELGISECNLCHPSGPGSTPVLTYHSGPGGGLGCAGCHGRDYGEVSVNSGQAKATSYGLRLHHVLKGETSCGTGGCHAPGGLAGHPNPLPTPFPENVPPPYYGNGTNNLIDSCDSAQEDTSFDGDMVGLDNDGDGNPDYPADGDCPMPTATPTPVPFACEPTPLVGCVSPLKSVLLVNEKNAGKEKIKVALKKLQPLVGQSDFGDPVNGSTGYKICVYDAASQLTGEYTVERAGDICGDKPCWAAVSTKGFKYKDKGSAADGILKMNLFGGDPGKGKVLAIGKNTAATMPTGVAAAMLNQTSATVQVFSSDGPACFSATLSQVKKADGAIFKAVGP